MDNSVMLDYLAVTIKGLAPDDVIEKILILPKDKFVLNEWGINKYQRHYAFSEIKVYFNKDWESKMGVFIELRGQGCRQYEEYMESNVNNWVTLMKRISEYHSNVTRLDIANDIFDDSLSVPFTVTVKGNSAYQLLKPLITMKRVFLKMVKRLVRW